MDAPQWQICVEYNLKFLSQQVSIVEYDSNKKEQNYNKCIIDVQFQMAQNGPHPQNRTG